MESGENIRENNFLAESTQERRGLGDVGESLDYSGTHPAPAPRPITTSSGWSAVVRVLKRHYHKPDIEAARALYASIAAHDLPGQPVWPMLVAPPGSMKTELLNALYGLPRVHIIDSVTPNTFISGKVPEPGRPKGKDSLLERIGTDSILINADFSNVLAMRNTRGEVLAQLRRIYDGRLRREFGTDDGGLREWNGRMTFVVAVTPEVDRHFSIFQSLGERFVMIRWHRPDGVDAAIAAMNQNQDEARSELREAVHGLLTNLPRGDVAVSVSMQRRIAALAEFAVRARTHVARNGWNKEVEYIPEPEGPTRFAQQLTQLAKGSALLAGRTEVTEEDFALVRRVAFDCIPPARMVVLNIARETIEESSLSRTTLKYARQDLQLASVGLLAMGRLTPLASKLLREAGLNLPQS